MTKKEFLRLMNKKTDSGRDRKKEGTKCHESYFNKLDRKGLYFGVQRQERQTCHGSPWLSWGMLEAHTMYRQPLILATGQGNSGKQSKKKGIKDSLLARR